jgi:uncharacterized protein with HEPN domain
MPPERADVAYLWDMWDAAQAIQEFVSGRTFNSYQHDRMLRGAVERHLEIIGEAANRVSFDFQASHPEIPWRRIKKLRTLKYLKIGHWKDAVQEQIPVIANLATENQGTEFWWYTRKQEIALAVNECLLPNLRGYLSLDPTTKYRSYEEYPYGTLTF